VTLLQLLCRRSRTAPTPHSTPAIDREPSSVAASPAIRLNAPGVPPQSVGGGVPELAAPVGVRLARKRFLPSWNVPVGFCSCCAVTRAHTCTWCRCACVRAFARACVRPRAVCTYCTCACPPTCLPARSANRPTESVGSWNVSANMRVNSTRAWVYACVHAWVHASVRPCVCACVCDVCIAIRAYVRMSAYLPAGQISKRTN
jgi:hypothetical protein